jgi:hypothetical protein
MGEKFGNSNENYSSNAETTSPLNDGELDMGQKNNKKKIEKEITLANHEFNYRSTSAYFKAESPDDFQKTGVNLLATHPLFDVLYNLEKGSGIAHYQDFQSSKINELNYIDPNAKNINERSIIEENAIPTLLFKYFNEENLTNSQTKKQITDKIRELDNLIMDLKLELDDIELNIQSLIASDMDSNLLMKNLDILNQEKNNILREILGYQTYIDCVDRIMSDAQNIKNAEVFINVMDQIKKQIKDNNGEISMDMLKEFRQDFRNKRVALLSSFPELNNADAQVTEFFDEIYSLLELSEFSSMSDSEKELFVSSQLMPQIMDFFYNCEIIKKIEDRKYIDKGVSNDYKFMLEAELAIIGGYFGLDLY